jgi:alkanesulfonate monooxygenase SsuD/methylene tetrahydromethanopterin reductase-like flavin-dependent oxidoreductase (luciferase family)
MQISTAALTMRTMSRAAGATARNALSPGLPYSYAHFINPAGTAEAIECYRARFRPSAPGDRPRVLLGIGVYCADTEEAAQQAFTSQRVFRLWATRNVLAPIPSPAEAAEVLRTGPDPFAAESFRWPRYVVGTPDRVREQITAMTAALDVDEVIVVATIHDHEVRVRSYELLAAAFDLRSRHGAAVTNTAPAPATTSAKKQPSNGHDDLGLEY